MSFFKNHTRRLGRRNASPKATGGGKTLSGELEKIIETSDPFNKKVLAPKVVELNSLPPKDAGNDLNKLCVLKFNGGLGTSMGMTGAKSALIVKNGLTFLDLTIQQVKHLNKKYSVDVPLLLMTSLHTEQDTMQIITKYANQDIRITSFNQSRYPRLYSDTNLPLPQHAKDDSRHWYPPGHGDLYASLLHSGLLDKLLRDGKEYLFVSNSDNLGATVDPRILQHMIDTNAEFVMEVTNKTKADIKGGTLVNYDGSLRLLELSQVDPEHLDDFQSVRKFGVFNTNNLWLNLVALKRVLGQGIMELDIVPNTKPHYSGRSTIELETTAGSAIKYFERAQGISVPRSRYLPVKNCSDLLLIKSDIYDFIDGHAVVNSARMFDTAPVVKLGDSFKNIQEFQDRLRQIPRILDLDHLTISGDVHLGAFVTLRGTVIIVAKDGQRIDIPDGCTIENRWSILHYFMISAEMCVRSCVW
ncbi:UTP-glucose-1-phosphate uridylyltransferase [Hymenopellis radicata]|nr:UTP-glucose-1-phosphate uridylyltransferase [Hymenopellis radicata]